jgi:ATP-dependent RNA helicase HelY
MQLPGTTSEDFERSYGFTFDPFQRTACNALLDGSSVLVAAPTGAGKTVVGEFAAWLAMRRGGKTFYTTPIKALSNQKFGDFIAIHGAENVGLLTGDNSINGDAPIVVMTTEVLRNMIYEDSPTLQGLRYVVLDEVHYLQDRYRGAVWEEVLIHLPVDIQVVSLSATVSNAEEFADWLQTLRGRTEVIIEEKRPVELRYWYFASDELLPMFVRRPDGTVIPNPRGREFDRRRRHREGRRPQRGDQRMAGKRARIPWRTEVVERLLTEDMLPAIYFIFSRKGCAEAVKQCLREGLNLTAPDERKEIREYAESRVLELTPVELDILGYPDFISGLERGIAAHHAGMIPPFKEIVEELFSRGLIRAVFATETLALGINMPARTVVIENLTKFTGEKHELITPGQFTQLAGRAGRRGIDEVGHAVTLLQRFTPFDQITRLASTRTYPLRSSFQPSYNMAVNLVRNYRLEEAEHLVNSSFAQFQANRGVVRLEAEKERQEAYLASYRERASCELGDVHEYRELVQRLQKLEGRPSGRTRTGDVGAALGRLKAGDVVEVPAGKRRGRYVVLDVIQSRSERRPRVMAIGRNGSLVRLSAAELPLPPKRLGRLGPIDRTAIKDPQERHVLAEAVRTFTATEPSENGDPAKKEPDEIKALRRSIESHPVHKCPELGRHVHFLDRAISLEREIKRKTREINRTTGTLARRFDQVLGILEQLGYVENWTLTQKGDNLTRVYNEADLLVVEALEQGLLDNLDPPEIAAVCSTLVYETRGPEGPVQSDMPTRSCEAAWRKLMKMWRTIRAEEEGRGLDLTREPDPGFAMRAHAWAAGRPLETVLDEEDAPGDFVRSTKQLVDLLRQLEEVTLGSELQKKIRKTVTGVHRGIVAYSSLEV